MSRGNTRCLRLSRLKRSSISRRLGLSPERSPIQGEVLRKKALQQQRSRGLPPSCHVLPRSGPRPNAKRREVPGYLVLVSGLFSRALIERCLWVKAHAAVAQRTLLPAWLQGYSQGARELVKDERRGWPSTSSRESSRRGDPLRARADTVHAAPWRIPGCLTCAVMTATVARMSDSKTAVKVLTVRVPEDLHREARILSLELGISLNGLISGWLASWVENNRG